MKNQIAKYAQMASLEAHEEWMELSNVNYGHMFKDILEEQIDKFDRIAAMANRRWYHKLFK